MKVLKVAHENLLEWLEIPWIGVYSGVFGTLGFRNLEARAAFPLSTSEG